MILVVENHTILRKFRTPKNLSEEGFQLFSCLAWPSEDKNKYWYYYHQSVQTPLDYFCELSLNTKFQYPTLSWVDFEWAHAHGNWAAWSSFPTHMTHGPLSCPIGDMTISSTGHEYGLMGLTMDFDVVLSGWKKFIFPGLKPDLCQMPMGCTTKYCGSILKECMTMLWWSIRHHFASEFS